jgi:hypothetical protein
VTTGQNYLSIRETPGRLAPKGRKILWRLFDVCVGPVFAMHNMDLETTKRAILERVFHVKKGGGFEGPPQPEKNAYEKLNWIRDEVVSEVGTTRRCSYESFVGHYSGAKRRIYENAVESLRRKSISVKDSHIKAFVKMEKLNLSAKSDPVPRLIQPRTPRFNVELGRFLVALEGKLYKALNKVIGGVADSVAKGRNMLQRGQILAKKWKSFADPVCVGMDAARFDQHVSKAALKFEHSYYNNVFTHPLLVKLLQWQLVNTGVSYFRNGKVKYGTVGCRCSGDMNTGLGNTILMLSMMTTRARELGIRVELFCDGDDCAVIMGRADLDLWLKGLDAWYLQFGFSMKVEGVFSELEKIEFCQAHPVWNGKSYVMVQDPTTRVFKENGWINNNAMNKKVWNKVRKAISDCGLAMAGDMPVLGAFYRRMNKGTENVKVSASFKKMVGDYRRTELIRSMPVIQKRLIEPEVRASFYLAFGVTPDRQLLLEKQFSEDDVCYSEPIEYDPRYNFFPIWTRLLLTEARSGLTLKLWGTPLGR